MKTRKKDNNKMSFIHMKWATKAQNLTAHEKLLLIIICEYADSDGQCFPKIDTLAKDCNISKSTAIRCLNSLCEKGLLKRKHRFKNKMKTSNYYTVNISENGSVTETHRSVTETPTVVSQRHLRSVTETPKPITIDSKPITNEPTGSRLKDFEKLRNHFEKMRGSPLSEKALADALGKWDYVIKTKKIKNPADKFIELMDKSIEFMGSPPPSLKLFIHQKQIKL